ncbi:hypothetical protein Q4Q81_09360 [Morganella morganii]
MRMFSKSTIENSIAILIAACAFYYFYNDIPLKWRFFGDATIAIISSAIIYIALTAASVKINEKRYSKQVKSICRDIGISDNSEVPEEVKRFNDAVLLRYSEEKFVNRITNLIGLIVSIVSVIVEVACILSLAFLLFYIPINDYYHDDFLMWMPVMWFVLFWVVILVISSASQLLFNRYPGEAKGFNKFYDRIRNT